MYPLNVSIILLLSTQRKYCLFIIVWLVDMYLFVCLFVVVGFCCCFLGGYNCGVFLMFFVCFICLLGFLEGVVLEGGVCLCIYCFVFRFYLFMERDVAPW